MIKIVSFKICPFVQRVVADLEAKEIPYEVEYISLSDKPEWFLEISPNGQVPVLITESGTPLFESDAIIEYIEEVHGALEQDLTAEQKALDRAWSYLASKNYLVQCSTMRSDDSDVLKSRNDKLGSAFEKAEKKLGTGPFFNGPSIGKVDIAWLPLLHRAAIVEDRTGYDLLAEYPRVKRWQTSLLDTGLAERSVAGDFEDVFSSFYLSDETHLGKIRVNET